MANTDDIRTERDQARSDLATERARSAGLTRALEVARGALGEVGGLLTSENFGWMEATLRARDIASRALTAIDAVTGGAAGDDTNRRLAAFDRILAARERWGVMAALDASFAMEVAVITDPWKNAPAAAQGTPGAGEAPTCDHDLATIQANAHGMGQENAVDRAIDLLRGIGQNTAANAVAEYFKFDAADRRTATPVAQRRPAREPLPTPREFAENICAGGFREPLVDVVERLVRSRDEAIEARDAEHAAAFEALEEHVACVYASEADLRMELAEAVGADALAAAPEAVSACRQHIDCVAADMAHMNAFGELASHGSLLDQARRAIDAAAPAVVPAETPPSRPPAPRTPIDWDDADNRTHSAPPREGMGPGERKP